MVARARRSASLDRVRNEIESIDRSIVLLLAARLDAAQRALRVRAPSESRLTDRAQERRVLGRAHAWARELDLPAPLVEAVFRTLIEEGKARYEGRRHSELKPAPGPVLKGGPEGPPIELVRAGDPELVSVPAAR